MKLQTALTWCASIIVTVAMAVGFLFMTFETAADADKNNSHFDVRLDRLEQKLDKQDVKIDSLIQQTK